MDSKRTVWALVVACSLCPALARAENVDDATRRAARNLGVAGVEAYQAHDYATASQRLEKAYQTLKVPSLGVWSARALVKLGKVVEAAERYQEIARLEITGGERAVQQQAQTDAATELVELEPQIPNLVIKLKGTNTDGASVTIDRVAIAPALIGENRPINPGRHHVQVSRAGQVASVEAVVALGETKTVELEVPGAAGNAVPATAVPATAVPATAVPAHTNVSDSTSSSTRRTLGYVVIGVGGAGLVVGGIASALAVGKKSDINENPNCHDNVCRRSEAELVDSYGTWRTVSSVGLIGGAALAGVGLMLVLTAPQKPRQTSLLVGPGSVTLSGEF